MSIFPTEIQFKGKWRDYQQECLSQLECFLKDNHFHCIAPPGSGKTILGLEIMIRIDQPIVICVPSIALQDQWIQRFYDFYVPSESKVDFISKKITNPKIITVVTYQSLFSYNKKSKENPTDHMHLGMLLQKNNISVLMLDEAHHLKQAWWNVLIELKSFLSPTIIALTATPPFDSSDLEWNRYITLNGPIDYEISIPELVKSNDLCPHKDFIYMSPINESSEELLEQHILKSNISFTSLKNNKLLTQVLFNKIKNEFEALFLDPEFLILILIYLKENEVDLSLLTEKELNINLQQLPTLSRNILEKLINLFFNDQYNIFESTDYKTILFNKLNKEKFIKSGSFSFENNKKNKFLNRNTSSTLNGIKAIIEVEKKQLNGNLRACIITDYIRKEYLKNNSKTIIKNSKLGVVPIFEELKLYFKNQLSIGILCGSIVLIPKSAEHRIPTNILAESKPYDSAYLVFNNYSKNLGLPQLVTQLFIEGHLKILIGTRSFLGEGWDANVINTLIIASNTKAYVSSNQIRGRALRTVDTNPYKTANIWHIINHSKFFGSSDISILQKRFQHFISPSFTDNFELTSDLNLPPLNELNVEEWNKKTFSFSKQRRQYKSYWIKGVTNGKSLISGLKISNYNSFNNNKPFILDDFILTKYKANHPFSFFFAKHLSIPKEINSKNLFIWFIEKIATIIKKSLFEIGLIHSKSTPIKVISNPNNDINVVLLNSSYNETNIFNDTIQEILTMRLNTRYLLKNNFKYKNLRKSIYFPIPSVFSKNKEYATTFKRIYGRYFGTTDLISNYKSSNYPLEGLNVHLQNLKSINYKTDSILYWK